MPHIIRSVEFKDETIAEPEMIVGFNDDGPTDVMGSGLGGR
ncbi:hypothetical protein [Streptomyces fructofermentans]